MIAGDTNPESVANGLLSINGCPGLVRWNVKCDIAERLDYFSLVKRPPRSNAIISVQYFHGRDPVIPGVGEGGIRRPARRPAGGAVELAIYSRGRARRGPSRAAG